MQKETLKSKLVDILDRRTLVSLVSLSFLLLLAYKGEKESSVTGIISITIALCSANALQRSAESLSKKQKID